MTCIFPEDLQDGEGDQGSAESRLCPAPTEKTSEY